MSTQDVANEAAIAAEQGDWATARHLLEQIAEPTAVDIDALADACWWMDDPRSAVAAWERAYALRLEGGDNQGASRTAVRIAREYSQALGNDAAANGWLQLAGAAIEGEEPGVEQGWIAICEAVRAADPAAALAQAEIALQLAREFRERELEIYSLAQVGIAYVQLGNVDEGMDSFDAALATATGGLTDDPRVLGDVFCGLVEACMTAADMSRTEQWLDVFNDYMQRYQHPPLLTFCSVCDAESQFNEGRWAEAEQTLQSAIATLSAGVRPSRCIHPAALLSSIRVDQSRFEEADQLMTGLEDLPEMVLPLANLHLARGETSVAAAVLRRRLNVIGTDTILASPLLSMLVQVDVARGDTGAATATARSLEAIAEASTRPQDRAMAELATGHIERAEGSPTAREHLERALGLFATTSLPLQAARTRLELATLAKDAGDSALAIDEAKVALAAFEEIGSVRDADKASRLLRDLGASGRSGAKALATLTGREREVLALLGQGLTNAEIAARLYISTKTAGHHVSNILAKLGMRNRSEAGAYAQRYLAEK